MEHRASAPCQTPTWSCRYRNRYAQSTPSTFWQWKKKDGFQFILLQVAWLNGNMNSLRWPHHCSQLNCASFCQPWGKGAHMAHRSALPNELGVLFLSLVFFPLLSFSYHSAFFPAPMKLTPQQTNCSYPAATNSILSSSHRPQHSNSARPCGRLKRNRTFYLLLKNTKVRFQIARENLPKVFWSRCQKVESPELGRLMNPFYVRQLHMYPFHIFLVKTRTPKKVPLQSGEFFICFCFQVNQVTEEGNFPFPGAARYESSESKEKNKATKEKKT